jgi:hypothetical protein
MADLRDCADAEAISLVAASLPAFGATLLKHLSQKTATARPATLFKVLALLPVGRRRSQDCQIRLRIAVLHELRHADWREDCRDSGPSPVSRKLMSSIGDTKNETDPRYDRCGRSLFADLREFSCQGYLMGGL